MLAGRYFAKALGKTPIEPSALSSTRSEGRGLPDREYYQSPSFHHRYMLTYEGTTHLYTALH